MKFEFSLTFESFDLRLFFCFSFINIISTRYICYLVIFAVIVNHLQNSFKINLIKYRFDEWYFNSSNRNHLIYLRFIISTENFNYSVSLEIIKPQVNDDNCLCDICYKKRDAFSIIEYMQSINKKNANRQGFKS